MSSLLPWSEILRRYGCLALLLGLVHAWLVSIVYAIVPDPYMDELFHIDQTRRYCNGNLTWNPMITTPPGLYLIALPLCGVERYTNSLLFPLLFLAACRFRSQYSSSIVLPCLTSLSLPVLLHSSVLFYTDPLSLLLTLLSFPLSPLPSSFFFLLSLFVRQTNIIWAFLYAGVYFFSHLDPLHIVSSSKSSLHSLIPFILLGLSFLSFLFWNDFKIVLGDASAHQPVLHLPQVAYFYAFSSVHSWPLLLPLFPRILPRCLSPSFFLLLLSISLSSVFFSFAHPYLLADNRHIPFYVYRRFLSSPALRCLLSPLFSLSLVTVSLSSSHLPRYQRLLFLLSLILTLVPAHLLEFRYFITPFVLWILSLPSNNYSSFSFILHILSNICVFTFVFLLFLFKPFEWANEPSTLQRFMW